MNNIKTRFQFLQKGHERPTITIYEHGQLLRTLHESELELRIGSTIPSVDEGDYVIVDIVLNRYDEEVPNHNIGMEMALLGDRLSFNFEVRVYLEKK